MRDYCKLDNSPTQQRDTCMLPRAGLAGLNWYMPWSKYVVLRAQGLVINETVSTVLHQASFPHSLIFDLNQLTTST